MKKPDISIRAREPAWASFLRAVDGLIDAAAARAVRTTPDRGADVHFVRTTLKRLRALLRLVRPVIDETLFQRENTRLRRAARGLGLVRDADVAREILSKFSKSVSHEADRHAFIATVEGLAKQAEPHGEIEKAMKAAARALGQSRRGVHRLRTAFDGWQTFEPGLRKVYAQCGKRMRAALEGDDPAALHKWRIRVKNLCHAIEFLEPVWPRGLGREIARLRKLERKLGGDHDLVMVKNLLLKTPDAFGAEALGRVAACLDKRSGKLRRASKPLGEEIFKEKPVHFTSKLGLRWNDWRRANE